MHLARLRRPALWQLIAGLGFVGVVAYVTVLANTPDLQNALYSAVSFLGVVGALVAVSRSHQEHRRAWFLYGAALTAMWLGDLVWTILAGFGDVPYPSVSDLFYLAGYASLGLATWWICTPRPGGDREGLVDAVIITVAGGLVLWILFIARQVTAQTSPEATLVSIGYPMFDVAIIGIIARVLLGRHGQSLAIRALMVGIAVYFVSDVVYSMQSLDGTYQVGVVDTGWLLGYLLFGVAAAHPSSAAPMVVGAPVERFCGGASRCSWARPCWRPRSPSGSWRPATPPT
jgi:hypothetical protein